MLVFVAFRKANNTSRHQCIIYEMKYEIKVNILCLTFLKIIFVKALFHLRLHICMSAFPCASDHNLIFHQFMLDYHKMSLVKVVPTLLAAGWGWGFIWKVARVFWWSLIAYMDFMRARSKKSQVSPKCVTPSIIDSKHAFFESKIKEIPSFSKICHTFHRW